MGRIEICGYEALGEFEGTDEDGNEIDPPQRVGEKFVIGVEDGYLVGGDLTCVSDDKYFSFGIVTISEALDWIKRENFEVTRQTCKTLIKAIT